jgi:two-component system, OmpR family, alkaline phosphatase synthesis response regulator PhoP
MNNPFENKLILIVDDEDDIRELLSYHLTKCGYNVISAGNGKIALTKLKQIPDLMVVDIMMPEMNGLELCENIRNNTETKNIPLIFLSARDTEIDEIYGLNSGADDYLKKPVSLKLLESRIQSLLRRTITKENTLDFGPLQIILDEFSIQLNDENIELTQTEFDILVLLAKNQNKVFSRDELINRVLGHDVIVTERTIDVHIRNIRQKLNNHADCVKSIRGRGYVFRNEFN